MRGLWIDEIGEKSFECGSNGKNSRQILSRDDGNNRAV